MPHQNIPLIWASILLVCLLGLAAPALAAAPRTLTYQGYLTDTQDRPVNGALSLAFAIYGQEAGGAALWR
ncbi:MAG: hypothetical protein KQJ78_23740, partial [Deltaproteobacteria bacterium]|nr:hypothetical protein [Deltaproteobacteria bacterium]